MVYIRPNANGVEFYIKIEICRHVQLIINKDRFKKSREYNKMRYDLPPVNFIESFHK